MKIPELHEKFIESINDRAAAIEASLIKKPSSLVRAAIVVKPKNGEKSQVIQGDAQIVTRFKSNSNEEIEIHSKRRSVVLNGEGISLLEKLSEIISEKSEFREYVDFDFVKKTIVEWIGNLSGTKADSPFHEWLFAEFEKAVKKQRFYFPLSGIEVHDTFEIGESRFEPAAKVIDAVFPSGDFESADVRNKVLNVHAGFLPHSVVSIEVCAEGTIAKARALAKAEEAVELLRFFRPDFLDPGLTSVVSVQGLVRHRQLESLKQDEHGKVTSQGAWLTKTNFPWNIDVAKLQVLRQQGLAGVDSILRADEPTKFQLRILKCMRLFSLGGADERIEVRLLYVLSSVESLLLAGSRDAPIAQNVGDRLAFALAKDYEERVGIIKNLRKVYEYRAKFFHHGVHVSHEAKLDIREFFTNVHQLLLRLIRFNTQWHSAEEFCAALERVKYGAGVDPLGNQT